MPRVIFQCDQSSVSHVSEIFYYKSKITVLLQTLIKASQHHQKKKIDFSNMWKKCSLKIGGFVKNAPSYLPAQSDSNKSLQEQVFSLQITTFTLKLEG